MGNRFKIGMLLIFFVIIIVLAITQLAMYIQLKQLSNDVQRLTANINEANQIPQMYFVPAQSDDETEIPQPTPTP